MPQNALHVGTAAVISGILGAQSYCSLNGNDAHSGSVKACFGHTEGATGIHGALLAIFAVQKRLAPAIMHMRGMNTYVSAAISDWEVTSNLSAAVPRVRLHTCSSQHLEGKEQSFKQQPGR